MVLLTAIIPSESVEWSIISETWISTGGTSGVAHGIFQGRIDTAKPSWS